MDCDGCTLCCFLLPVPGRSKRAYQDCRDCEKGVGCKTYDRRPCECVGYQCMYRADELCSENLRPDRVGVLFEKLTKTVVLGTMVDDDVKSRIPVLAQVRHFRSLGLSVVLHSGPGSPRRIAPARNDSTARVVATLAVRGVT